MLGQVSPEDTKTHCALVDCAVQSVSSLNIVNLGRGGGAQAQGVHGAAAASHPAVFMTSTGQKSTITVQHKRTGPGAVFTEMAAQAVVWHCD